MSAGTDDPVAKGDWARLTAEIAARRAVLGLTQREAAARVPLSLSRWNVLEKGRATGFRKGTLIGVSRALGWTDGSAEVVLQGGDPVIAQEPRVVADEVNELRARVEAVEVGLRYALLLLAAEPTPSPDPSNTRSPRS